jgi:hypothetical protein
LGVLNGPVADFVFRRRGKPKIGGYFEANKQFIAPLPIPKADVADRAAVAAMAGDLQARWSERRQLLKAVDERLSVLARARHREDWLWPDLDSIADLEAAAPGALKLAGERRGWADTRRMEEIAVRLEALQARLDGARELDATFRDGELVLFTDGAPALNRIYLNDEAGELTRAYWHWLLLSQTWRDAGQFAADLRRPPTGTDTPAAAQFIAKVADLAADVAAIAIDERAMNDTLYRLYDLSEDERLLVENQRGGRLGA